MPFSNFVPSFYSGGLIGREVEVSISYIKEWMTVIQFHLIGFEIFLGQFLLHSLTEVDQQVSPMMKIITSEGFILTCSLDSPYTCLGPHSQHHYKPF